MGLLIKLGLLVGVISIILSIISKWISGGSLFAIETGAYIDFAGVAFLGAIAFATHCLLCQSKGGS
jgi:hypothetical protein